MELSETSAAWGAPPPAALRSDPFTRADPPVYSILLWPHRSLSRRGFRWVMGIATAGMALPILTVIGSPVALGLLPPTLIALGLLWGMIESSYRSGRVREELRIWRDAMAVERRDPAGRVRRWAANPYWVQVDLEDTRATQRYLTLRGAGRRIELGAFLTPEERVALADEIRECLAGLARR